MVVRASNSVFEFLRFFLKPTHKRFEGKLKGKKNLLCALKNSQSTYSLPSTTTLTVRGGAASTPRQTTPHDTIQRNETKRNETKRDEAKLKKNNIDETKQKSLCSACKTKSINYSMTFVWFVFVVLRKISKVIF